MKILKCIFHVLFITIVLPQALFAQADSKAVLKDKIKAIIDTSNAKVGVGILGLDFDYTLLVNGNKHFPMQSVYKFPLAIAILNMVDNGDLSLAQIIHIPKDSIDLNTWSPMAKDYPNMDIDITLADLLTYTISKSDNNGCDALFRLVNGTDAVNKYVHSLGVKAIHIAATEAEMKKGWQVQYTNWCTPIAMLQLIDLFYKEQALSSANNDFLMKIMTESQNSPNRIKGLLPAGAIVAHKTGTSNTNNKGLTAATNDAGIITLPNGRHVAIVVYVSDFKGGAPRAEQIIANIAKLTWDALQ